MDKPKILVTEDDADARQRLAAILKRLTEGRPLNF